MKTVINIKTDKEIKEKAQKLAKDLGVPLSVIINAYLRQFIKTKEFTFSMSYQMTPELEKVLAEVEKDIAMGKNLSPAFEDMDEAIAWLEAPQDDSSFS